MGPIIWFSMWRRNLHQEVDARVAAIRAEGLPVNWEDLAKWPSEVKDSENAAFIYTNAIGHLDPSGIKARTPELPPRGEPLSDETKAKITADIKKDRGALDIAYSAGKSHESRYPVNYEEGLVAKLPHLAGLKRIAYLMECDALLKAQTGDSNGAARAISATFKASESLDNEPIVISQLFSVSILTISCRSLERTLCRVALSDQTLAKIYSQIVSAEATNRMLTALIGERATDSEYIRLAQEDVRKLIEISNWGQTNGEQTELPARNPGFIWRYLGFFERDRNFYLRAMETNIQMISLPPPKSLSLTNEVEKLGKQASSGYYIFSTLFLPSLSRIARTDASIRSILRIAITAIAVERWRDAHNGEIPNSLEALVPSFLPAVPSDPYTGQPLKFKKLAKGYVVYSVGPDGQDDGGKEQPTSRVRAKLPPEQRDRYDITFTVER